MDSKSRCLAKANRAEKAISWHGNSVARYYQPSKLRYFNLCRCSVFTVTNLYLIYDHKSDMKWLCGSKGMWTRDSHLKKSVFFLNNTRITSLHLRSSFLLGLSLNPKCGGRNPAFYACCRRDFHNETLGRDKLVP